MSLSGFPNGFGVSGFGSHQKNRALLAALCHMSSLGKGVMGVTFFFFQELALQLSSTEKNSWCVHTRSV